MSTNFPNGVSSYGMPVIPVNLLNPRGKIYFVDANNGVDGNSGTTINKPFLTMSRAFGRLVSGDNIVFWGNVREQLVTPVQIFDITVVGASNRPRHADSTPSGGQSGATWRAPASGAVVGQANVRVLQQGWKFVNFLMAMESSTAAGIEIVRNAGAGNAERDGSHASIIGCRFAGAGVGVRSGVAGSFTEIPYNVEIGSCKFNDNTTAISGAIINNSWHIHHNVFQACTNNIVLAAQNTLINNNYLGSFTTSSIVLTGGAGLNVICFNYLSGTYSIAGGYTAANANDEWGANGNSIAGGWTAADPA